MKYSRHLTALGVVASLGVTACSDQPATGTLPARVTSVPLSIQVSSATAALGARVAVAVSLDQPASAGGVQGTLTYDASRLRYVGQSQVGSIVSVVNAKSASSGTLKFVSYSAKGISGRAALLVFEARGAGYASSIRFEPQAVVASGVGLTRLSAVVRAGAFVDATLPVPSDARYMTIADWKAIVSPAASGNATVALRPGQYRANLQYGDADLDGSIGLFDALGAANAAVGLDQLIIGTDVSNVDLVIAGNVAPDNGGGACGTEPNGSRVIDVFDILAIENEVAGFGEPCVGDVIPGRGPTEIPATRQSITTTSSPDLIVGPGETVTLTNDRVWQLEGILDV
ncbi:MAG TPA: cohesin domain-containing protein, partial [Gemmatimonadaceae bacterium]|nr:cohesin domain-containing protein [Gemmatimonadaceae bacterium]